MIGQRFGRLVVIGDGRVMADSILTLRCQCDCGETSDVYPWHLTGGLTKSCGCLRAERMRATSRARTAEIRERNERAALAALPGTLADLAKRLGTRPIRLKQTLTRLIERGAVALVDGRYHTPHDAAEGA